MLHARHPPLSVARGGATAFPHHRSHRSHRHRLRLRGNDRRRRRHRHRFAMGAAAVVKAPARLSALWERHPLGRTERRDLGREGRAAAALSALARAPRALAALPDALLANHRPPPRERAPATRNLTGVLHRRRAARPRARAAHLPAGADVVARRLCARLSRLERRCEALLERRRLCEGGDGGRAASARARHARRAGHLVGQDQPDPSHLLNAGALRQRLPRAVASLPKIAQRSSFRRARRQQRRGAVGGQPKGLAARGVGPGVGAQLRERAVCGDQAPRLLRRRRAGAGAACEAGRPVEWVTRAYVHGPISGPRQLNGHVPTGQQHHRVWRAAAARHAAPARCRRRRADIHGGSWQPGLREHWPQRLQDVSEISADMRELLRFGSAL
mmetsp:Transcript_26588/g.55875  ORF Transcript_26588/g.55875 Transcript_26588/m.55875 type:complete len:387 (+) Transcript_26588:188-1348(+)